MSLKQKQGITSAEWEVELVVYLVYIIFKQLLEHTLQNEGSAVRLSDSDSSINYQRSQKLHRNHTAWLTPGQKTEAVNAPVCGLFCFLISVRPPPSSHCGQKNCPPTPSTRRRPPLQQTNWPQMKQSAESWAELSSPWESAGCVLVVKHFQSLFEEDFHPHQPPPPPPSFHCVLLCTLSSVVGVSHGLAPCQDGHFGVLQSWNLGWSS